MHPVTIILIAVGLGADAMSVCTAVGVKWHGPRQKFRLAWHMGLFQFLMPLIGSALGRQLAGLLRDVGVYVAGVLVAGIGLKMLIEAWKGRPGAAGEAVEHAVEGTHRKDPTRGWSLMALSVATSLDALVAGVSLGLRGQAILIPSIVIGLVAALMSLLGVILGQTVGRAFGRWAEVVGAIVLIGLGVSFPWI